jgi:hypothetical protein
MGYNEQIFKFDWLRSFCGTFFTVKTNKNWKKKQKNPLIRP